MASKLKVHVHVFRRDSPHVARRLAFRDYLRAHPSVAAHYCALKQRLAAEHPGDGDAYQAGKADFIERVEADAVTWAARARVTDRDCIESSGGRDRG